MTATRPPASAPPARGAPGAALDLAVSGLWRVLLAGFAVVAGAGLAAELAYYLGRWDSELVPALSLSYEHNLPTWYASALLFACAVMLSLLALAARRSRFSGAGPAAAAPAGGSEPSEPSAGSSRSPGARHWVGLSAIFLYISLDEVVGIHERASGWFATGGVLYFGWVIPGAIAVAAVGAVYLPFLRRLHPVTRRRFVLAAVLYVTGGLIFELPLGYWTERAGNDNLVYALIDWVEECLELVGASVFCAALLGQLAAGPDGAPGQRLHLVLAHRPDEAVVPEVHD